MSYELRVFCELRVSREICKLVHSKCELRVPEKNFKFPSFVAKQMRFLDSLYKITDLQKSFLMFIISNFRI